MAQAHLLRMIITFKYSQKILNKLIISLKENYKNLQRSHKIKMMKKKKVKIATLKKYQQIMKTIFKTCLT